MAQTLDCGSVGHALTRRPARTGPDLHSVKAQATHDQPVGNAAVSPMGCTARGVSAVSASVTPISELECTGLHPVGETAKLRTVSASFRHARAAQTGCRRARRQD